MALYIADNCTGCNLCLKECPNKAISESDDIIYVVDPDKCTECVGFFDMPQCVDICPIECIFLDADRVETEPDLLSKAKALSPDTDFGDDPPSHFKNPECYSIKNWRQ